MVDPNPHDHPFYQVAKRADELAENGVLTFQKFTCSKCGLRQMIEEPNVFYTQGKCEKCGHVTNLVIQGCNYMAMAREEQSVEYLLERMFGNSDRAADDLNGSSDHDQTS